MECDLHGYEQAEAYIEILHTLKECKAKNDQILQIIHGFNKGTILKSYVQSQKFIAQMKKEGFRLSRKKSPNPGTSCFKIEP
ncbi:hypothetical protein NEF87_003904 [Candidatus Lokiarchaeum ossiferum]|uniref:Smr domain-containing protein n=1 Tax=Candidatus Lokiarchaeum ossiferum TaxID=2951803 RepID=A0ABY6HVT3_9ARCH|nr:hypothetical protein NEF87_003904 [Candidatus Lokiarchaeum sp. B-35]